MWERREEKRERESIRTSREGEKDEATALGDCEWLRRKRLGMVIGRSGLERDRLSDSLEEVIGGVDLLAFDLVFYLNHLL